MTTDVSPPLVSVVIPAFHAADTICDAVRSVLAGGVAEDRLEILIESDDGTDYAQAAALSPAVRVAASGVMASGAGPARNRALDRARGDWVTFLDADDVFATGYLADLLPHVQREGAAAAPLQVRDGGRIILDLWSGQPRVGFDDVVETGASVRVMLARENCGRFDKALSQDILHALQVMSRHGGSLPLGRVPYILRISGQSVTAAQDFSDRVQAAYLDHVAQLEADGLSEAAQVFRAKIALNKDYAPTASYQTYYAFIAERLGDA